MRVFYVAIFATAALFATAIARPGLTKKRHARKARSLSENVYQQSQSNPNSDAIPTDWKYNQLDQDSAVPHYPDFPKNYDSGWQNQAPNHAGQVFHLNNRGDQEFFGNSEKSVDQFEHNKVGEDMKNVIQKDLEDALMDAKVDQQSLLDLEEFADELHLLNIGEDRKDLQKAMQEYLDMIRLLQGDKDSGQDSNGDTIPPVQKTHLPDLSQENINADSTGGSSNDIEPPFHKAIVTTLGEPNNAHEVDTNNIDQYWGGRYPHQKTNQNQDFNYGSNSEDDDSSDDDSLDEDDDSSDEDFSNDSSSSEEDSQSVEGFDGQASIDRRLGNGLDDPWAQKKRPHSQRWKRSSGAFENGVILLEKCMLICEGIRRTGKDLPVQSAICDCANAPHME